MSSNKKILYLIFLKFQPKGKKRLLLLPMYPMYLRGGLFDNADRRPKNRMIYFGPGGPPQAEDAGRGKGFPRSCHILKIF